MAVARRTDGTRESSSTTPAWRISGEHKITLELDTNEAEAIASALRNREFTAARADGHPSPLHETSLIAGGARVHEALTGIGVPR